jgi:hypothetical protein
VRGTSGPEVGRTGSWGLDTWGEGEEWKLCYPRKNKIQIDTCDCGSSETGGEVVTGTGLQ